MLLRLVFSCAVAAAVLSACDDPVGPQPDKPIKPPEGYTGAPPPGPPGPPPAPKPSGPITAPPSSDAGAAPVEAAAPEPEAPKCPADVATTLTAKAARQPKDKKKRIKLELGAKSGGPSITFRKVVSTDDGTTDDVEADGAKITAFVLPESAKAKAKLVVTLQCGWEDRTLSVTVDGKSAAVTTKEIPPPPEPGFLNLLADPGMKVTANGKDVGVTPLRGVPLTPGKYQLKIQPPKGKPKTASVEIKVGQTSNVALDQSLKK